MTTGRSAACRVAILTLALLGLAGCSGDETDSVSNASIAEPPARLVSNAEIAAAGREAPGGTFLRYWSMLQYSSWSGATSFYEPALVRRLGVGRIIEALKTQGSYFSTAKPVLGTTDRVGDQAILRYTLRDSAGIPKRSSVAFRRSGGQWRIHHQPQLDAMLQSEAQTRVQADIDATASRPSARALAAAAEAGRLQSEYLAEERR